jgi:hypothetical protein
MKNLIPLLAWLALVGGGNAPTEHSTEGIRAELVTEVIGTPVPAGDTLALTRELLRRNEAAAGSNPEPQTLQACDASHGTTCFPSTSFHFRCGSGRPCDHAGRLPDLIAFATQAATERPDAGLIMGFAVHSMVRQGNVGVASDLVSECRAQEWWCSSLEGYVLHASGDQIAADDRFRSALTMAPDSVRCEFVQPNRVLVGGHRRTLDGAGCAERSAVADTVWWLADPLYASEPNDRYIEHLARTLVARSLIVLNHPAGDDRRRFTHDHISRTHLEIWWDWYVPRGHPDSWRRRGRTTPTPYELWTSRPAARYHFVPDFDGDGFGNPTWRLEAELDDEGYTPSYGTFHEIPTQVARFRNGGIMQVAVAGTVTGSGMRGTGEPHLILTDAPGSFPVREVAEPDGPESRFLTEIPFERHVLSHEVLGDREFGRFRIMLEPLDHEGAGLSDLLLYHPDDDVPPHEVQTAATRMLPGTRIEPGHEVGVYWESYGVTPDAPIHLDISLEGQARGGILGTLRRLLPGGGPATPVRLGWSETADSDTHPSAVTLDLSELDPGSYTLVLEAEWDGSDGPVETRRVVRVGS